LLSVIKVILIVAAVVLTTASRTYAAHSGADCYLHGHRIYVPDGLNYPRQAWAGWGITCRTATPEVAAGSAAIGADDPEGRPAEWCGWWMRQHLGGRYGPEFNIARNWLNAGPAVTIARSLSDTFAGIAPAGVIAFIAAQFIGMLVAVLLGGWLWRERVNSADSLRSAIPPRKEAEMM
jgi:hypothetical protein